MKVLQSKIAEYILTCNNGPVVPHYDNHKVKDPECEKVIMEHTTFVHPPDQMCGKWTPVEKDPSINQRFLPKYVVEPYDDATEVNEKGPYSDDDMGIVYTCS